MSGLDQYAQAKIGKKSGIYYYNHSSRVSAKYDLAVLLAGFYYTEIVFCLTHVNFSILCTIIPNFTVVCLPACNTTAVKARRLLRLLQSMHFSYNVAHNTGFGS